MSEKDVPIPWFDSLVIDLDPSWSNKQNLIRNLVCEKFAKHLRKNLEEVFLEHLWMTAFVWTASLKQMQVLKN